MNDELYGDKSYEEFYLDFVKDRIPQLRLAKGISAHKISVDLGFNRDYVNHVELGKMKPALDRLFLIMEYLGVTPAEFFDLDNIDPAGSKALYEDFKRLDMTSQEYIRKLIADMHNRPK